MCIFVLSIHLKPGTMKKYAKDLKAFDVIHIPATFQTDEEKLQVKEINKFSDNTVIIGVVPIINNTPVSSKYTEMEYGQMVELDLIDF
jgi:hypothetical protein